MCIYIYIYIYTYYVYIYIFHIYTIMYIYIYTLYCLLGHGLGLRVSSSSWEEASLAVGLGQRPRRKTSNFNNALECHPSDKILFNSSRLCFLKS